MNNRGSVSLSGCISSTAEVENKALKQRMRGGEGEAGGAAGGGGAVKREEETLRTL